MYFILLLLYIAYVGFIYTYIMVYINIQYTKYYTYIHDFFD